MKMDLLFVMPSMDAGGGEKSLVNLLQAIDYSRFNVDLLLLHKQGFFLQMIPAGVSVIEPGGDFQIFKRGLMSSVLSFLKKFKFGKAWSRYAFFQINRKPSNKSAAEQESWRHVSQTIPHLEKSYDVAIGFLEKSSIYYIIEKVSAVKKIGWIHTNYTNSGMKREFDLPYFAKLDHLVAVSAECGAGLTSIFPEFKSKVSVIHNIISGKTIRQLAEEPPAEEIMSSNLIVSVGRLSREKGFDLAIDAASELKKREIHFRWIVIGDGPERESLKAKIEQLNLGNCFSLIGLRANPFAYVSRATVYVQPSRYEGKSIAIDEAKILRKAIVATDYPTVSDQINDGVNGIVAEISGSGIAAAVERLLSDDILRGKIVKNLEDENCATESEIERLYNLIQ